MIPRVGAVALLGSLLALLIVDIMNGSPASSLSSRVAQGDQPTAPAFSGRLIWDSATTWPSSEKQLVRKQGGALTLDALRGHVVVLNFWASWCIGCKEEARSLDEAAGRFRSSAIFVGVDANDLSSAARQFLTRYAVPYPSIADPGASITTSRYGIVQFPETYVVSANGRIAAHLIGPTTVSALGAAIRSAA